MFEPIVDLVKVISQVERFFQQARLRPRRVAGGTWIIQGVGTTAGGQNVDVWVRVIPDVGGTLVFESFTNMLPDPTLPGFSSGNMLALFRDLLELNGGGASGDAYFTIKDLPTGPGSHQSAISVEIRRPIRGLDFDEFQRCLTHVAVLADENDERLAHEFNAPKIRVQV
jgi:hypothetical protein